MAESPTAAANVWTTIPELMPRTDRAPARRPWATLRARMYIVSVPGVIQSRKLASRKAQKSCVPNVHFLRSSQKVSLRLQRPGQVDHPLLDVAGELLPDLRLDRHRLAADRD